MARRRRLRVALWIPDGQGGTAYLAQGSTPTAEQAERITNPHVWEDGPEAEDPDEGLAGAPAPAPELPPADSPPAPPVDGADVEDEVSPADVPDGTVAEVLAWVDGDAARARAALTAERAADKPRTTLVAELEDLAESGQE